jgi:membrane fusion protein, heavy metal efflux system
MHRLRHWLLAVVVLVGCGEGGEEGAPVKNRRDASGRVVLSAEERQALDLAVETAPLSSLAVPSTRYGRVVAAPNDEALVVAPFPGRLGPAVVPPGAEVEPGDLLVTLQPLLDAAAVANLRAEAFELQGQIEGARARLDALASERNRVKELVALQLATTSELAKAEAEISAERASLEGMERSSNALASVVGGPTPLSAPIGGRVVQVDIRAGDVVAQGTRLVRILRPGPRFVELRVPPSEPPGALYRVQLTGGTAMEARFISRGEVVAADGTRTDRLILSGPDLLPDMTVAVEVVRFHAGVVIPASAVVTRGRESLVFVEVEEGRYAARPVVVEARAAERVLITGLDPGQHVVIRGAAALLGELEGSPVRAPEGLR